METPVESATQDLIRKYQRIIDDMDEFLLRSLNYRADEHYIVMHPSTKDIYPPVMTRNYDTRRFELKDITDRTKEILLFTKARAKSVVFEWNYANPDQKVAFITARSYALQVINSANNMIDVLSK